MRPITETTDFGKIKHLYDFGNCIIKKLYIDENKSITPPLVSPHKKMLYIVIQGRAEVSYDMYDVFKDRGSSIDISYPTIITNRSKTRLILLNIVIK